MPKAKRARSGERTPSPGQHPLATDKEACAPNFAAFLFFVLGNQTKETVRFVCDSGGEEDSGILRQKIPQAVKLERRSIGTHERLDKIAADRIVIVDEAVPEIANPEFAFHESKAPWGIELAA